MSRLRSVTRSVSHPAQTLDSITDGGPIYPLLILFGLNAVDELDRTAFGVLLPEIREEFGLNLTGVLAHRRARGCRCARPSGPDRPSSPTELNRITPGVVGAAVWAVFSVATGLAWAALGARRSPGPAPASARRSWTRPTTR